MRSEMVTAPEDSFRAPESRDESPAGQSWARPCAHSTASPVTARLLSGTVEYGPHHVGTLWPLDSLGTVWLRECGVVVVRETREDHQCLRRVRPVSLGTDIDCKASFHGNTFHPGQGARWKSPSVPRNLLTGLPTATG